MYVLFFGLHVTNNLQVYNLQLVYNVTCLQFTSLQFTTCLFIGIGVHAHKLYVNAHTLIYKVTKITFKYK